MSKIIYFSSDFCFPQTVNHYNQEQLSKFYEKNKNDILNGKFGYVVTYNTLQDFADAFNSEEISDLGAILIIDQAISSLNKIESHA